MKTNVKVAALGAIVLIVGMFMPWIDFLGMSKNAWSVASEIGVPIFFLSCAVLIVIISLIPKKWVNIFSALLAIILVMVGVKYINDAGAFIGTGLYLFLAGGFILLIGSIMGFTVKR